MIFLSLFGDKLTNFTLILQNSKPKYYKPKVDVIIKAQELLKKDKNNMKPQNQTANPTPTPSKNQPIALTSQPKNNTENLQRPKEQKSSKTRIIILSVTLLYIVVIIAAFFLDKFLIQKRQEAASEDEIIDAQSAEEMENSMAEDLENIRSGKVLACINTKGMEACKALVGIADAIKEYTSENKASLDIIYERSSTGVPYKPDYLKVATDMLKKDTPYSYGLRASIEWGTVMGMDAEETEEYIDKNILVFDLYEVAEEYLLKNGFVQDDEIYVSGGGTRHAMINYGSRVVCYAGESSLPYRAMCNPMDYIEADSEEAILLNNLADAYNKKQGDNHFGDRFGDRWLLTARSEDIENSPIEPYQKIKAGGMNSRLMFYRTSPTSEWIFFGAFLSEYICQDFNTDELKKAFYGETCRDNHTWEVSTVAL